ncbi:MAG: hypothetical protein JST89_20625 [Cyanobacteria bacterium SZAS-4]|nr:hypothetical protein [Cyanobacteria bacterium SZAS-4]
MRSVAKGNYIKGAGGVKHALAHVRYLQMRGGDDREHALGGKRLFIDANRSAISGSEVNERIKQQNENGVVIHRVVLSPGVPGVDLDNYVRAVLSALKHSTGQDIEYYATKHRNTDHDHSHVVIMGRDEHGKQVRMNRHNYKTIREAGDRYLERNHLYDRFLDKELQTLMRDGYKRDRGDQSFERLLEDLKDPRTFEECDEQRRKETNEFIKEFADSALPKSERIDRDNVIYTKYSSLEDLLELDRKLVSGELPRLSSDQYQKMWSWIGNKKQFGNDYYVRKAEADRLHQQFDEDLKRSLHTDNSPPKSFKQYIFESRGRLLEWHEKYEINTQRSQLQKHIDKLDQSGSDDLEKRAGLIEQLDWLDAMAAERIESKNELPEIQRSKESENSMQSNFAENRNLINTEERDRWGSELVDRAWKKLLGDHPEIYDKASPQGRMSIQEALGREISKLTAEDHQQHKLDRIDLEKLEAQQENYVAIEKNKESIKLAEEDAARDETALERDEIALDRDGEDASRVEEAVDRDEKDEEQDLHDSIDAKQELEFDGELERRAWTNVTKDRVFDLYELKPDKMQQERAVWRQEIEKVYVEDEIILFNETNSSPRINFDDRIEGYQVSVHDRAYTRAFEDRTWDFANLAPEFQERIIDAWSEEVGRLTKEDERSLEKPDSETVQNRMQFFDPSLEPNRDHSCSDINTIIFDNEPSITLSEPDKTRTDQQIDLWQEIAFSSEPDKHHQTFDQTMSQQVQQDMHQQIQQSFLENQHIHTQAEISKTHVNIEQQREREDERIDDGREHTR